MSSDFDGLYIFPAPCSQYEQFVNLYSNINKNQPRRARFAAAQAEWTSAKKAGRMDTVFQAMKEKLQSRGSNVESQKANSGASSRRKTPQTLVCIVTTQYITGLRD